jgi:MFS family permease
MVLPLMPIYADQYTVDQTGVTLGLLMASYSAMQCLFSPWWGRLSDHIGRRPVIMIGLSGSVLFYFLFGLAAVLKSLPLLFVGRIGAGIAGATIATAQAYIADTTTLEKRSKGMALIGMAFGMGFTFGPLLGFLAVPKAGSEAGPWPGYAAAILSAIALALAAFRLPESLQRNSQPARHREFSLQAWRVALRVPSIPFILVAIFVCIFSFANFETTLSLLVKGSRHAPRPLFEFSQGQVCLTYAFIGLMLALVQGGIVRRLADKIHESRLATTGAAIQVAGFGLTLWAIHQVSVIMLFVALGTVVSGFAFMQPNLQGLLSRRSDPAEQGLVLGVGQSVSSLARIFGAGIGIPLLWQGMEVPYVVATVLMILGTIFVLAASRRGHDFVPSSG